MPQEQTVGADFLVSVEAETDQTGAMESDILDDTVSYADMAEVVREEMAMPSRLVEHVAGRIGRRLTREFPTLSSVTVRITKVAPPIEGLQCNGAGVEVSIENEKN